MSLNLAMILKENAVRIPNKVAVICDEQRIDYQELDRRINRLANTLLSLGVERGQAVTLMLPNIPEFIVAYFAIVKIGAICVPINTLYKEREIEYILSDSESVAFIACSGFLKD